MTPTIDKNLYGSLLAEFQPKIVSTEAENEAYLQVVENLMAIARRSPEQDALLDLLVLLIENFEAGRYELNASTPQSILQHLMEVRNIQPEELVEAIGSLEEVLEILGGDRLIEEAQALRLAQFFSVPSKLFATARL